MRILPLDSSSTNFKHWGVPQNRVFQGWGWFILRYNPNFFISTVKSQK